MPLSGTFDTMQLCDLAQWIPQDNGMVIDIVGEAVNGASQDNEHEPRIRVRGGHREARQRSRHRGQAKGS